MTHPTYELAKTCPKCSIPGEVVSKAPVTKGADPSVRIKPGTQIHTVVCRNEACPWFESPWIVQVNPDGSVPPPTQHKRGDIEKAFPNRGFSGTDEARVVDALQRQLEQETRPGGGEIGRGRR